MADNLELQRKRAFAEIKPRCIAVSQLVLRSEIDPQTSRQLVKALEDLLQCVTQTGQTDGLVNPAFGDYIFFPLSHIFGRQQIFIDRVIDLSLQCVNILLLKCWHVNIAGELAKQLMIMVAFILGGPPDGSRPSRASEETKLAATKCLESLFAAVTRSTSARAQFGLVEISPSLGHSLTVLLDVIPATSFTELQVSAISAAQHLFTGCISDDDILASFFPGTVSTLCKFLDSRTSGSKKSKALVKAIETLSDVIRLVLMDIKTSHLPASDGTGGVLNNDSITTVRTQSWLHATSEQVRMGLTGVFGLRKHRMLNVKKALLKLSRGIARDCTQSLNSSLAVTVETLVSLSADKEETLSSDAREALITLAGFNENITEVLEKSLHGWILSLPRVLQENDEDRKSHLLREIAASFKILSDLSKNSEILLDLFSRNMKDSILNISESGLSTISPDHVVASISPATMELIKREAQAEAVYPATIMPGKTQEETSNNTLKLLQMLGGTSIGLQLVHEHVREARVGSDLSKAISMWMALNILRSSQSQPEDDWLVSTTATSTPKASQLIAELYSVALLSLMDTYDNSETHPQLTCITLEVLAYTATTMGTSFRPELVDCLYPVVHLFGSSISTVQQHAIITLESLARSSGYSSTRDLLVENSDYLVNAVSLKLNMFNVQPQAPQVLLMMIKLAGPQLVPVLDDLVVSIFAALENYHGYEKLTESLFAVLEGIVVETAGAEGQLKLITDGGEPEAGEKRNRVKRKHAMSLEDVLGDLDELIARQSKPLVEEVVEETPHKPWGKDKSLPSNPLEEEDQDEEPSSAVKVPEPKPNHTYLMIESIARLSQNFLTSRSSSLRLHLLHLISTASPVLSKQEDSFLPLINQLWPVVVDRLKDSEPAVTITTIKTITRLCIDCGEFLSSRIEESWPVLREIAFKAKEVIDKERGADKKQVTGVVKRPVQQKVGGPNAYAVHNQIWSAVVPMFEALVGYTRVTEEMFDDIVGMVGQEMADEVEGYESLREALEGFDGDVVWLEMVKRSEVRRARWMGVPEKITFEFGDTQKVIEFEPVAFNRGVVVVC